MAGQGRGARPGVHKWRAVMEPITKARAALGLNGTDLSLLRAILSFIPSDLLSTERPETHICFAGNLALAERIGASGDSTVNRGLRRLEAAGLILRRQSANRKRYARRDRAGVITRAYGIDLSPLILDQHALTAMADAAEQAADRINALREDCKAALLDLRTTADAIPRGADGDTLAEHIRNTARALRRKLSEQALADLRESLFAMLREIREVSPERSNLPERILREHAFASGEMSNTVDQHEQHLESGKELPDLNQGSPITFGQITEAFPTLMTYFEHCDNFNDIQRTADILATSIGDAGQAWHECKRRIGFSIACVFLGFIIENHETIKNPGGYLRRLTRQAQEGNLSVRSLLRGRHNRPSPDRLKTPRSPGSAARSDRGARHV